MLGDVLTVHIIFKTLSLITNIFTIAASSIAIYLFIFKRSVIMSAFKVLLNYSAQITFSELQAKIDRLNDLNANEPSNLEEIINIFSEIVGQIRGNKKLRVECAGLLKKLVSYTEKSKKLTEPMKRSVVSELRESLKYINIESFDELIGGEK